MVALPKIEVRFWRAQTKKNLNFSRCIDLGDLVLKSCSDINKRNGIQLPLSFAALVNIVVSLVGMSFFHPWVTFQVEVFSYRTLAEMFANGFRN